MANEQALAMFHEKIGENGIAVEIDSFVAAVCIHVEAENCSQSIVVVAVVAVVAVAVTVTVVAESVENLFEDEGCNRVAVFVENN